MGRLKLIIKQGSNFSIELYSDNLNNSLLILQAKDSSGDCLRKLIGVSRVGVNPVKIGEMHECLLTVKHLSFEKKVYSPFQYRQGLLCACGFIEISEQWNVHGGDL